VLKRHKSSFSKTAYFLVPRYKVADHRVQKLDNRKTETRQEKKNINNGEKEEANKYIMIGGLLESLDLLCLFLSLPSYLPQTTHLTS
jgi:hypothetical protein